MLDWTRWPNFSEAEMACKGTNCCGGRADMDEDFMDTLQAIRWMLGFPLYVTSGYRCPEHNDRESKTGFTGPHTTGKAADIPINGEPVMYLLREAFTNGITGIGSKQHGDWNDRMIHLDTLDTDKRPRHWTYE